MPSITHALLAVLAGLAAGTINAIVGSGTLISFPVLLGLGVTPVTANMVSSLGLLAGNVSSIAGYRRAIADGRSLLRPLVPAALAGGVVGALLLLLLPESSFRTAVPYLVGIALILVAIGPWVQKRVAKRAAASGSGEKARHFYVPVPVLVLIAFLVSVYGGYFGAAQGILLIGFFGIVTSLSLPTINGVKVVNVMLVNLVSGAVFVLTGFHRIDWWYVLFLAIGSVLGGFVGAHIGKRLSPWLLRAVILVVGGVALVHLILQG